MDESNGSPCFDHWKIYLQEQPRTEGIESVANMCAETGGTEVSNHGGSVQGRE